MIFPLIGVVYKKECFKETMAVKGSLTGRAPVVVSDHHVALVDRSGFQVNLHRYDNEKFPVIGTTSTAEVELK